MNSWFEGKIYANLKNDSKNAVQCKKNYKDTNNKNGK